MKMLVRKSEQMHTLLKTTCRPYWEKLKKPLKVNSERPRLLFGLFLLFFGAVTLAEVYEFFRYQWGLSKWEGALRVHLLVCIPMLCFQECRASLTKPEFVALLTCTFLLQQVGWLNTYEVSFVLWVPLVEEWIFRFGLFGLLRRFLNEVCLIWVSAILFSFQHSWPTLERVFAGHVGLVGGPLLLGFLLSWIYLKTYNLGVCILFHGMANLLMIVLDRLQIHPASLSL